MTKSTFNLAAALETLRTTDRTALDKLLLESASAGHVPAIAVLLDGDAHVNARNTEDRTPLHFAALQADIKIADRLIAEGANLGARDIHGCTPLNFANGNGHSAVGELLRRARETRPPPGKPAGMADIRWALEALQRG